MSKIVINCEDNVNSQMYFATIEECDALYKKLKKQMASNIQKVLCFTHKKNSETIIVKSKVISIHKGDEDEE